MKSSANKRIALIYPSANLSTIPPLVAMIKALIGNGYEIDLFTCPGDKSLHLLFNSSKIHLCNLNERFISWKHNLFNWVSFIFYKCIGRRYALVICVDPHGLFLAGICCRVLSIQMVYLSFEIYSKDELKGIFLKLLKSAECYFNKKACFTIIQDQERAALLRVENKLSESHKILLLPNSSSGGVDIRKTDILRKKFCINEKDCIILYSGSIYPDFLYLETARSAHTWDARYKLIIHSGRQFKHNNDYAQTLLKEADSNKVYIDINELSDSEYDQLVRSSDIGLAFYTPRTKNLYHMGLSSGKVSKYLQCGIPVIMSNIPALAELVKMYKCGIIISDISELKSAIENINCNYAEFSSNAARCFSAVFNIEQHLNTICEEITNAI